jgi:hypothetical protein
MEDIIAVFFVLFVFGWVGSILWLSSKLKRIFRKMDLVLEGMCLMLDPKFDKARSVEHPHNPLEGLK